MAGSYPIVTQLELGDPAKRWRGKRRDKSEIPTIRAHEVLVWRVGDEYVVDSRQLSDSDDVVVDASSVSVVSVRPGTEVAVFFEIDSQDASVFTVKVTFVCSVTDAAAVVRAGQVSVADTLLAYLRGYQDLFNIGLKYPITAINDVRTEMAFQVKAYMTLRPPEVPGTQIGSVPTVQVKTPAQIASFEDDARRHRIEMKKQADDAELDMLRQGHLLDKAARLSDAVARDSRAALGLAATQGDINSADHAERLLHLDAEKQQGERAERLARETREFAVADRTAEWDRDDTRERIAAERESLKDRLTWERAQLEQRQSDEQERFRREYAVTDRAVEWERDRERDRVTWERSEIESERAEQQEKIRRLLEAEEKYLEALGQAGHFDTHVEDVGEVMQRIRRTAVAGLSRPGGHSALTDGAGEQAEPANPDGGHGH